MATFALMHGGFHTSKCWEVFAEELERRGHQTLTVDFPVSDPGADPDRYLQVAVDAFGAAQEPVVVVGHSIAGWNALRLEQRIPVAGTIFLCSCINLPAGAYPAEPVPMIAADPADWTPDERGVITMGGRPVSRLDANSAQLPTTAWSSAAWMYTDGPDALEMGHPGPAVPVDRLLGDAEQGIRQDRLADDQAGAARRPPPQVLDVPVRAHPGMPEGFARAVGRDHHPVPDHQRPDPDGREQRREGLLSRRQCLSLRHSHARLISRNPAQCRRRGRPDRSAATGTASASRVARRAAAR